VEIAGELKGELKARSLSVLEKGRVDGTIDVQRLAMREGALLNGSVNTGDGRSPARASLTGLTAG
jgi:cytoskeletal protein CcmA (bactofilin family)